MMSASGASRHFATVRDLVAIAAVLKGDSAPCATSAIALAQGSLRSFAGTTRGLCDDVSAKIKFSASLASSRHLLPCGDDPSPGALASLGLRPLPASAGL